MLSQLRLENFRCFSDHTVPFQQRTVMVGKNNAGKSTIVDALRLIAIVSSRFHSLIFKKPPAWLDIPKREVGVSPSIKGLDFDTTNIFFRYGEPPARITASFTNGSTLKIYVGTGGAIHAVIFKPDGSILQQRPKPQEISLISRVEAMPQVGPVARLENLLTPEYVRSNLASNLAHIHFRNQIHLLNDRLPVLRQLTEITWPGLQIQRLNTDKDGDATILSLLVRNEDFVAEIASMGHGLQMWLQTMWFLSRVDPNACIILDEPDIYMHPDLQRRLIRYLRTSERQIIVTTHSVEIMAEVAPEEILVIDRQHEASKFAMSLPAVQRIIDHFGSAHNLQLTRFWHTRKFLLVEGNDFRLLCDFFDIVLPHDQDGLALVPHMSINGWSGWPLAIGSSMLLRNAGGQHITIYCILDSDYHTEEQKKERQEHALKKKINLHIWKRKEIENYILNSSAIARLISERQEGQLPPPSPETISQKLDELANEMRNEVFDGLAAEYHSEDKSKGSAGANRAARLRLDAAWESLDGRLAIVSGKGLLTKLSKWSQEHFGVQLNASAIARAMKISELPDEIRITLNAIARGCSFD